MLHSKVVSYQTWRKLYVCTHFVWVRTVLRKCDQFTDICQICSTTDHTWPRGTPVMRFSAKCAFSICLGIRKSTEQNFESEKSYSWETEVGGLLKPPLGSRGLILRSGTMKPIVYPIQRRKPRATEQAASHDVTVLIITRLWRRRSTAEESNISDIYSK